jgi:PmbA protein
MFSQNLNDFQNIYQQIKDLTQEFEKKPQTKGEISWQLKISESLYYQANVREILPEHIEQSNTRGLSLTIYHKNATANITTADLSEKAIRQGFEKAFQITEFSEADEFAGLANAADLLSTDGVVDSARLNIFHPQPLVDQDMGELEQQLVIKAQNMQAIVRSQNNIVNSEGCGAQYRMSQSYLANSLGFQGLKQSSLYSIWANAVAQDAAHKSAMQTESWSDQQRDFKDLENEAIIAKTAAEHATNRLNARSLKTQKTDVIFINYAADELLHYLLDAISGHAQYHQSGFLTGAVGKKIMPEFIEVEENPFLNKGLASGLYDSAGVATTFKKIIDHGHLTSYLLNAYFAKKLKQKNTGHAGGTSNLIWRAHGEHLVPSLEQLIKNMHHGLIVTDIMGPGFNELTGDYSKGAAGFWVENGEISYPVEGITVAGNILDMYKNIQAMADDALFDTTQTGSLLIGGLTVAGS